MFLCTFFNRLNVKNFVLLPTDIDSCQWIKNRIKEDFVLFNQIQISEGKYFKPVTLLTSNPHRCTSFQKLKNSHSQLVDKARKME